MTHPLEKYIERDELSMEAQTYGENLDSNSQTNQDSESSPQPVIGNEPESEGKADGDTSESQLNPTEIVFQSLPEELEETVSDLSEIFGEMGVTIVGFGSVDIADDSLSDENEFVGSIEDINSIDIRCAESNGPTRFVYTIHPQKAYNLVSFKYDLLNDFFLAAEPELFQGADPEQQINIINRVLDQLSQEDISLLLEANRNISLSEMSSWLSDIRLQLPQYHHQIGQTDSGELTMAYVQKRMYCSSVDENQKELYESVQEISNLYLSYNILGKSAYLKDGVNIPDSTFKMLANFEEESGTRNDVGFQ